jgi:hypothetical protein
MAAAARRNPGLIAGRSRADAAPSGDISQDGRLMDHESTAAPGALAAAARRFDEGR